MVNLQQQIYGLPQKAKQIFKAPQPSTWERIRGMKRVGFEGTLLSLPFVAMNVATAPQGYKGADAVSSSISELVITPALTAAVYLGLSVLLPGIGSGLAVGLIASGLAAGPSDFIETRLNRVVRGFRDIDKNLNRLQLGYTDTPGAQLQRQTAIRDMSGAFGSSRRFLGQEARILHR